MKSFKIFRAVILSLTILTNRAAQEWPLPFAKEGVVRVWSEVTPSSIVLKWQGGDQNTTGFKIFRKDITPGPQSWPIGPIITPWPTTPIVNLGPSVTTWTDWWPPAGRSYEYQIERTRNHPLNDKSAFGYTVAGISVPPVHSRGKLIIVYITPTAAFPRDFTPPQDFKEALAADGWQLVLIPVHEDTSVSDVKAAIKAAYLTDTLNTKAVLLLGHVRVPYSGLFDTTDFNYVTRTMPPDYHDNHGGAWPADAYYGDMSAEWSTGLTWVAGSSADGSRNYNTPARFDATQLPSDVELPVGRVDFKHLAPSITKSEAELMAQYFKKNVDFRMGKFRDQVSQSQAAIADYWQDSTSGSMPDWKALSGTAWGNFPNFTGGAGPVNIEIIPSHDSSKLRNYFVHLDKTRPENAGYLWSGAFGDGSFSSLGQEGSLYYIGETSDWQARDIKSVFVVLGGSYFGDWDSNWNDASVVPGDLHAHNDLDFDHPTGKPSFLRAALASSSYTLAAMWAGRPAWFLHHMALGYPLGYSTLLTQNNKSEVSSNPSGKYFYQGSGVLNAGGNQVHVALIGDPTLRTHIVKPPGQVTGGNALADAAMITWTMSPDRGYGSGPDGSFVGYYVYRGPTRIGPFTLRAQKGPEEYSFYETRDPNNPYYLVRAARLERYNPSSGAGVYENLSAGILTPNDVPIKLATVTISGSWTYYPFLNGGGSQNLVTTTSAINRTGLQSPAPEAVYKSMQAEASLNWSVGYLSPTATYKVRVHLCSIPYAGSSTVGDRIWVSAANGAASRDANPYAGGVMNKAMIVDFSENFIPTASGELSGQIVPMPGKTGVVVSGIEILKNP